MPDKDRERMKNYWLSQQVELVALSPKPPFIYAKRPKINVRLVAKKIGRLVSALKIKRLEK